MKFRISRKWLVRKLARADDTAVGAGGTSKEDFKKDMELRTVSPSVLADSPTELGRVVRFVRVRRGWSCQELAVAASLDEAEVNAVETDAAYRPTPRAVVYLADALGLSRRRLQELVGFVTGKSPGTADISALRFAANSRSVGSISENDYEAVRALVEVLSEKKF